MKGYFDKNDINKRVKIVDDEDKMYIGKLRNVEYVKSNYEVFEVEFNKKNYTSTKDG